VRQDKKNTTSAVLLFASMTCGLIALGSVVTSGCAVRQNVTVENVASSAFTVLGTIDTLQNQIIASEREGVITEGQAAQALIQIRRAIQGLEQVSVLLTDLDEASRTSRLEQATVLLFTASQMVGGIALPVEEITNTLTSLNTLLLRVHELRSAR
jgi:outer membrane murein-binding lipoprotein Lpp